MQILRGFATLPTTRRVLASLEQRSHRAIGGLWGASQGLLLHTLQRQWRGSILVLTADDDESLGLAGDVDCFRPEQTIGRPPFTLPIELRDVDDCADPITRSQRIQCLSDLTTGDEFLLVTSLHAFLQPVPSVRDLRRGRVQLRVGDELDQESLLQRAVNAELRKVPVVIAPGEVSRRGDVLDIFPLAASEAYRLEFFDGELESIRTFDAASQRSLEVRESIELNLSRPDEACDVLEHLLQTNLLVIWVEPQRLEERQVQLMSRGDQLHQALTRFKERAGGLPAFEFTSLPSHDLDYKILSAGSAIGSGETDPLGRLRAVRGLKGSIRIFCPTPAESDRLQEIFARQEISLRDEHVQVQAGSLSRGFRIADLEMTLMSNTEFAGVPATPRRVEKTAVPSRALSSFFELGPGDTVVHAVHGIARFETIELVERGAAAEDHLRLVFKDDVRLLVPASKIHLVQKYVGSGDARPRLDKLGGKSFAKRKEDVARSLFDMASDLLDLSAARATFRRDPYPSDDLEEEFLDSFPFTDTTDQTQAWREIRADLEGPSPMDRLLCGDVGFGKTEVAMRAAFKVAITGRQVAVLVPTTVLAEQHGRTFGERFEPHGLIVDVLSRFRSTKERKAVLAAAHNGRVDVLIGTHRILSDDVKFQDLGLLIVDEEQRFGVRHKEHVKQMRRAVDVLTLSATPIPRTMHASLVGIRDISTLAVPPVGRQDVDTRMSYIDPVTVQTAIRRELSRQGQVYYLHNRVASIERTAKTIAELVPEARVVVGHGQMTELQMEKALRVFIHGGADVLVCTTIIENGLDIARANTMLIERADLFGLAELHQLRGRIGRSSRLAHCLLLLDRTRPVSQEAKKRLKAIEEFSSLGAGFAIAMKDLEIRGAGNILGPQQSGHIAAVGYEMYCRLLKGAMDSARQAPPSSAPAAAEPPARHPPAARYDDADLHEVDVDLRLRAFVPDNLVADPKTRLELLREMDRAEDPESATTIGRSIVDRFGKLPDPVQTMLFVFLLKHQLMNHGVLGVQLIDHDRVIVRHPGDRPLGGAWLDHFAAVRLVEPGKTHLILPPVRGKKTRFEGADVLALLLKSLLGSDLMPKIRRAWLGEHPKRRRQRG